MCFTVFTILQQQIYLANEKVNIMTFCKENTLFRFHQDHSKCWLHALRVVRTHKGYVDHHPLMDADNFGLKILYHFLKIVIITSQQLYNAYIYVPV